MTDAAENSAPRLLVATVRARGRDRCDLAANLRIATMVIRNEHEPLSSQSATGTWRPWEYTITEGEPEPAAEPTAPDAEALHYGALSCSSDVRWGCGEDEPLTHDETLVTCPACLQLILGNVRTANNAWHDTARQQRQRAERAEAEAASLRAQVAELDLDNDRLREKINTLLAPPAEGEDRSPEIVKAPSASGKDLRRQCCDGCEQTFYAVEWTSLCPVCEGQKQAEQTEWQQLLDANDRAVLEECMNEGLLGCARETRQKARAALLAALEGR